MKTCKRCYEAKGLEEFHRNRTQPDGRMVWCKPCNNDYARSKRSPERERTTKLRAKFGLTDADYAALFDAQGGVCAICKRPETRRGNHGKIKYLAVDHDHRMGRVRGLLCHDCNVAIGYLADDPERLRGALDYLGVSP